MYGNQYMYTHVHFAIFSLVIFSIFVISAGESFGQTPVTVDYHTFENTILLTFQNNIDTKISTIHVWLDDTSSFKSIKTEQGWSGRKNSDGIISFTSQNDGLDMNRHVKFGLITNTSNNALNWRSVASNDDVIASGNIDLSGKPIASNISTSDPIIQTPTNTTIPSIITTGISDNSEFRLVPTSIRPGSNVRIIGTQFTPNQNLGFYLDDVSMGNVVSDNAGNFVGTMQLSSEQEVKRVDIIIRDDFGNSKDMSIRVSELNTVDEPVELPFEITTYPEFLHVNDKFTITGTGSHGDTTSISFMDPNGTLLGTTFVTINQEGFWEFSSTVKSDAVLGTYTIDATLGSEIKSATIELTRFPGIDIHPVQLQYEHGETLEFTGFAPPNSLLDVSLVYKNTELFYTELPIGSDGVINLKIPVLPHYKKDTYVLYASLEDFETIVSVGIGVKPDQLIFISLDELHYSSIEDAEITITGPPSANVNLLILNPSDNKKESKKIILDSTGIFTYVVDLSTYSPNVYTVLVDRGNVEFTTFFTVDFTTFGEITSIHTPSIISPGQLINLIGTATKNTLIDLELYGPESKSVDDTLTYSNKDGQISNRDLRLPRSANISDDWYVIASVGANFIKTPIKITDISSNQIIITATHDLSMGPPIIQITGSGASDGRSRVPVPIVIYDSTGKEIESITGIRSLSDGTFSSVWEIPSELLAGKYVITTNIGDRTASTTFTVN